MVWLGESINYNGTVVDNWFKGYREIVRYVVGVSAYLIKFIKEVPYGL